MEKWFRPVFALQTATAQWTLAFYQHYLTDAEVMKNHTNLSHSG